MGDEGSPQSRGAMGWTSAASSAANPLNPDLKQLKYERDTTSHAEAGSKSGAASTSVKPSQSCSASLSVTVPLVAITPP